MTKQVERERDDTQLEVRRLNNSLVQSHRAQNVVMYILRYPFQPVVFLKSRNISSKVAPDLAQRLTQLMKEDPSIAAIASPVIQEPNPAEVQSLMRLIDTRGSQSSTSNAARIAT